MFVTATDLDTFKTTYAPTYKFRTCGTGVVDNKGTKSKGLLCADMEIQSVEDCKTALGEITLPEDGTAICLVSNSDSNVCAGDYGGKHFFFYLNHLIEFKIVIRSRLGLQV